MRIFVTGMRGLPGIPGGIEQHAERICPLIAQAGHEVRVAVRRPYAARRDPVWNGVQLVYGYAPKSTRMEAILHTFISLGQAWRFRPDILHLHAVGPALVTPLARLVARRVVVTHHGPDQEREKWGLLARTALRAGEASAVRWADEIIVVAGWIAARLHDRYGREATVIPNGVLPLETAGTDAVRSMGLEPGRYLMAAARFVPEKGLHDLVAAFAGLPGDLRLVLAGDADHPSAYSRRLRRQAAADARVLLPGYLRGAAMRQALAHARLFVLPSRYEGHPLTLLEALVAGVPVLAGDIPANREVGLPADRYFPASDVPALQAALARALAAGWNAQDRAAQQDWARGRILTWDEVARRTLDVYARALASPGTQARRHASSCPAMRG
jgi:glycosyltransferase involved in cell wall biosynthesis